MTPQNPNQETLALFRYRLLLLIAVIPVFFVTLFQAIKHRDLRFLLQRFGVAYTSPNNPGLWLHAASVGEVLAVLPLIDFLQKQYPQLVISVSTVTPTGGKIARQKLPAVNHIYLPLDLAPFARRFIHAVNAGCGLIMETELWPNLYHSAAHNNVTLITINGRLSPKTMNTKPWVKALYRQTLRKVSAVLAKSAEDEERFVELGADPACTHSIGNLKFAIGADFKTPVKQLGIQRPFVLAASTHHNEEEIIANIWKIMGNKEYLLVIAPRHPYRSSSIVKQLNAISNHVAVRSKGEPVCDNTEIYLADTLGELLDFMRDAELVFMGGSMVPTGGHNILEPAILGKAMVFGPYMHNFHDEAQLFLQQKAAVQVNDEKELQTQLALLLEDPALRATYGDRAEIIMQGNRDIVQRYAQYINQYCELNKLLAKHR